MIMAKVMGTVVATRKEESLVGYKLMIVCRIDSAGNFIDHERVAVDYVGAGIGEIVLVGQGSAVRVEEKKKTAPIDMAIVGIIDTMDVEEVLREQNRKGG
ncbi:MAG: EutN/CcmL family microcompartment protein [Hespellia sp.]|nr:EutN/CcmL family microcompartment protein [Hespellia sp.]